MASMSSSSSLTSTSIPRDDDLRVLADKISSRGLVAGSVVAPVWPPTGGGSAMGSEEDRKRFVQQVDKACRIGQKLRDLGVRPYGVVRIDSAASPSDWLKDPAGNMKKIAETFREACNVAEGHGERLAAEGEICWGGMHSWRKMVELLEMAGRPEVLGFQADMAHTLLFALGYNAPEDCIVPEGFAWQRDQLDEALAQAHRGATPLDHRLPRGAERRRREGLGLARQDRPSLPADRSQRQAQHRARRRLLAARRKRQPDEGGPTHLLGRLHVPQCDHDEAGDVEQHSEHDDRGAGSARLELKRVRIDYGRAAGTRRSGTSGSASPGPSAGWDGPATGCAAPGSRSVRRASRAACAITPSNSASLT